MGVSETGNHAALSTEGQALLFSEHDAILQTLDRESNKVFLNKEAFAPSVKDWEGVPLIFAQDHPDPAAWDKDPKAELARIKGRMVQGKVTSTFIEMTGHPRLMGKLALDDPEIERGIKEGKISTSNGFRCPNDGTKLTGTVAPHHILFFWEREGTVPGDKGVVILNTDAQAEKVKLIDRLKALLLGGPEEQGAGDTDMGNAELETKVAQALKEAGDAKLAFTQLQEDLKAKDGEIARLKAENMAFLAKEADAKWLAFKGKYVPPGMVADADKEKAARAEYDKDALAFTMKLLDLKGKEAEGAEPMQFTAPKPKSKADQEITAQMAKMGIPSLTVEE